MEGCRNHQVHGTYVRIEGCMKFNHQIHGIEGCMNHQVHGMEGCMNHQEQEPTSG